MHRHGYFEKHKNGLVLKKVWQPSERTGRGEPGGWAVGVLGASKAAADQPSQGRAAAMATLKAAGDPAGDAHVCADLYSDMATVTSSAGESKSQIT